jgi:hypothetical protein
MASRARLGLPLSVVVAALLGSPVAQAQTVTATAQPYPERFENGVDLGQSTRPINLNPFGVNYEDCIGNMVLQFNLALNGFTGAQNMQIWATANGDCTATTSRAIGSTAPTCWQLEGALTIPVIGILTTRSFNVRVQDLVGPQNAPPNPPVVVNEGASACSAQTTFAAVPITVWFLPLDLQGNSIGTPFSQTISADLVGPPPPIGVSETVGDTLFNVIWTPNTDADTTGYDIFMDAPASTDSGAPVSDASASTLILYCPDASTSTTASSGTVDTSGSTSSAGSSGTVDTSGASGTSTGSSGTVDTSGATSGTSTGSSGTVAFTPSLDAGCFYVNMGPSSASGTVSNLGMCTSTVLSSAIAVDGGASVENEAGVVSSGGGISTIPCQYVIGVGPNCYSAGGQTVTGESTTQYTIKGLTNGTTYDVVVAAVDGSGNVGPPSSCVSDYPAPVNDFWDQYRAAGGQAGGGFCALEAVGLPVGSAGLVGGLAATLLAILRHRRRGKR